MNEAVSSLFYVMDDFVVLFHNSLYAWLLGNGYRQHDYSVTFSKGYKRLFKLCKQIVQCNVSLGDEITATNEVLYLVKFIDDHEYKMARDTTIDKLVQPQTSQSDLRQGDAIDTIKSRPEKDLSSSRKRKSMLKLFFCFIADNSSQSNLNKIRFVLLLNLRAKNKHIP